METINETSEVKGFFKKLIDTVTENVKEGASLVSTKVAETSTRAIEASAGLVNEASGKIHDFTEKRIIDEEKQKIEQRLQVLQHTFGALTLGHYLKNDSLSKPFLTSELITAIIQEYQDKQKRLSEIATIV